MQRRTFFKTGMLGAAAAYVPAHNFDKYDFGSGPPVQNRLNQGPFPADLYPSWTVVMALTPSEEVVPNFGMGLMTYLCDEKDLLRVPGKTDDAALEELVRFPLGSKLYLRMNWKDVQTRPGRLDPNNIWKTAFALSKQYSKRIAFRVMISNPDIPGYALPDFLLQKVPMVKLGSWEGREREEPRCDDPAFQAAFRELLDLLATEYDGNPNVEFVDTCMYGFWGEGHTWPLEKNPYPDYITAENTFVGMLEEQLTRWKRTPLTTNTQPDFSKVGNSELVDRTIRSGNWLRTDTIFIENEQIEALSNRPPWTAAAIEVGTSDGSEKNLHLDEGISYSDNVVSHAQDVGANYFSLWNWHHVSASGLQNYYRAYPHALDRLARRIGYRIRPSWVWTIEERGAPGLIIGFANDGIAGVPGVLRVSVMSPAGEELSSGCLDPGYPVPGHVRQALFVLPKRTAWQGLRLKAEIEVKGQRYAVRWACHQKLNNDGTLTLHPTAGLNLSDETGGTGA
ncbi:MAG TPA: hypothetical protein VMH20_10745 [Verrucomicrobiae bacterium]|nr:hypothetical protein [Verrucomicrobiae bacterium]